MIETFLKIIGAFLLAAVTSGVVGLALSIMASLISDEIKHIRGGKR